MDMTTPPSATTRSQLDGICYVPGYLDQETHNRLMSAVDEHPWQMSADRRVQVYGYSYNHQARSAYRVGVLPAWADELARRLSRDGYISRVPNQLVANDYRPGVGIFAHIDQEVFGEVVISVSLGSSCVMRFTDGESRNFHELFLEANSLLVLSGDGRSRWKHEIPGRTSDTWGGREYPRSRRVSLTFRAIPD
jgi:alkylated DNA repair dioxygenase AlkB